MYLVSGKAVVWELPAINVFHYTAFCHRWIINIYTYRFNLKGFTQQDKLNITKKSNKAQPFKHIFTIKLQLLSPWKQRKKWRVKNLGNETRQGGKHLNLFSRIKIWRATSYRQESVTTTTFTSSFIFQFCKQSGKTYNHALPSSYCHSSQNTTSQNTNIH